ncbi:MAG: SDR family NAD(P)-dependent oxidoreductase [Patescibacteria group bacterium]|nr:SDR family NAD(P)-dependent oxidoreductase [Patescibacteria group bacterium]
MQNKTILISGGVTGIGAATALEFLEHDWQVSVFSNVKENNEEFLRLAKSQGLAGGLLVLDADITKEKDLKKVVAETKKKFKTIDVLFNNAGMGYFTEADKVDVKKFDQMMEVNVIGMADLTKQIIPIIRSKSKAR